MKHTSALLAIVLAVFVAAGRPSAETTPLARIAMISAGEGGFALALRQDGTVLSWGANAAGTLGNGTTDPNLLPSAVFGLGADSDVVTVAASTVFALALKADGTVVGWGANALGQLGDGTFTNRPTPVTSATLGSGSGVVAIAAGLSHAVALKADGSVWSWGSNNNGNLGNPAIVGASNMPVPVVGLGSGSGVVSLTAGGNFTLALKADGTVWAWGNNNNGQLGIGNTINQPVPVQVKGPGALGVLSNIVALSAPPANGGVFALALSAEGTLWAWGNNSSGQLGDGTTTNRNTPVQVKGVGGSGALADVTAIDAGGGTNNLHALAVQTDGTVLAWGSNSNGQLGTGDIVASAVPVPVVGLGPGSRVVAVSAGTGLSLALNADGSVLAWGDNSSGQLGDGTFFGRTAPTAVAGLTGIRSISTQILSNHSLAIRTDGVVVAWGNNDNGQLGTGDTVNQPVAVAVPDLNDVIATAVGASHSLALTADGTVWAWGDNSSGQLGIGSTIDQLSPVQVRTSATDTLQNVIAIAAGGNTSYALTSDGTVFACGINTTGQLGTNRTINESFAVPVHGIGNAGFLTGVTAIAANGSAAYALTGDVSVLAWGQNTGGQLADGTLTQRLTPVQVSGLGPGSGVISIAAIAGGAAALKSDGSLLAWGLNVSGQIGDGTTTARVVPVAITGLGSGSGVVVIGAGGGVGQGHTFGLKSDGTLLSWGANGSGQLGDGTLATHLTPQPVPSAGSDLRSVVGGALHSLALDSAGNVWSWGANGSGQLGDGTTSTKHLMPAPVLFEDVTPPAFVSLAVSRTVLWPPNGAYVPVTVSGIVEDADSSVASATYAVTDEYGLLQPAGTLQLDASGRFSVTFMLEAARRDDDREGRQYLIVLTARDPAGNTSTRTAQVTVPHHLK
jgi:alpha-tubulin suppressor-like RCC1 family protein